MGKRLTTIVILLFIVVLPILVGCLGQPQQTAQAPQEPPPPDLTNIELALRDPSPLVRKQAVENLKQYSHSVVMNTLIGAIKDNSDNKELVDSAVVGVVAYKDAAIDPVKKELWNSQNPLVALSGLTILSQIGKKEEFYPEVQTKFYNTPYNEETTLLRRELASFITKNARKDDQTAITDTVAMLSDADPDIAALATKQLSTWKNPLAIDRITELYYNNTTNPDIVTAILNVLNNYDAPTANNEGTALTDISIFLETFGCYNETIQKGSYEGLKKFGYNDQGKQILNYIKRFDTCDNDLVRSHVLDLLQTLSVKQYPADAKAPIFKLPLVRTRDGFCSS